MVDYKNLAEIVYSHSSDHYNDKRYRWDYVVETYSIQDIAEELEENNIKSKTAAIRYFKEYAKLMSEMHSNAMEY